MTELSPVVLFADVGINTWIVGYQQARLSTRNDAPVDAYLRILRQFLEWVAGRPGHGKQFQPDQLTVTVVEA